MELVIYTPKEDGFIKAIEFNHAELKKEISASLEKYQNLTYTDDNIVEAKTDRATLNKFREGIENKRKEIKKKCLEPYDAFEAKIKELTTLIEGPLSAIDSQVKAYDNLKKEEKRAEIVAFYEREAADIREILPFERLENSRWLNVTYKIDKVFEEITEAVTKTKADLENIDALKSEYAPQMKDIYLKTLDLSAALREKSRLEEQAAKMKAYEEQKRTSREEQEMAESVQQTLAVIRSPEPEPAKLQNKPEEIVLRFFFTSKEQKTAFREFLKTSNIRYERA